MDNLGKHVNNVNTIIYTGTDVCTGAVRYAFKMFRENSIILLLLYMNVIL